MARIRTLKPDFWTDEKIVELSPFARLLFMGLWNFADDEGRMEYSPKRLKMQIFPADSLDLSELIGEIERTGMVHVYAVDGIEYLQVVNFAKHQKIDKRTASKYPSPPISPESPRVTPTSSESRRLPPTSAEFPRVPPTEGKGREGNGGEGNGNETSLAPDASRREPKIEFDFSEGVFKGITETQELAWQEAFPAVPVPPAIAQAAAWLQANPANRKSNYARFLFGWFKREQDKAPRVRQ